MMGRRAAEAPETEDQMPESLYLLAVLACPVGMGVMMWMMMRGQGPATGEAAEKSAEWTARNQAELVELRAEIDQLRVETDDYRGKVKSVGSAL
jgi:hypothetical protein